MEKVIFIGNGVQNQQMPYFMNTIMYELDCAERQHIVIHESWSSETIRNHAGELLFELKKPLNTPAEKIRCRCLPVMKRSIYRIDATLWINCMELLVCKYCRS